jgi:hypothetical protein
MRGFEAHCRIQKEQPLPMAAEIDGFYASAKDG